MKTRPCVSSAFIALAYGPLGRLEGVDQVALLRKPVARPQSFQADVILDPIGDRLRSALRALGRDEETLAVSTGFLFLFDDHWHEPVTLP